MALSSELLKKFKNQDVPLSDKLCAAKKLFFRKEFYYIIRKEELVLEWLLELQREELENNILVWETIRDCLKSDNMKNLRVVEIKSATIKTLVKLLIQSLEVQVRSKSQKKQVKLLNSEDQECFKEQNLLTECSVLILENSIFLYYFRKNIEHYIDLSHLILKSATKRGDAEIFVSYMKSIEQLRDQGLKKEDVYKIFIQKLYLPIIEAYCSLKRLIYGDSSAVDQESFGIHEDKNENEKNVDIKRELLHLIQKIIFPGSFNVHYKNSLQNLFESDVVDSWTLKLMCKIWENQLLCCGNEEAVNLYVLIFEAFVHTFQNDFNAIYKCFVTISVFLGFEPTIEKQESCKICLLQKENISKALNIQISDPVQEFPFLVLKEVIDSLKQTSVVLEETINEISFKKWMQALIIDSIITCKNSSLMFSIMTSLIQLNPLIVEPIINQVLQHVLLIPKVTQAEKENYKMFFLEMFNMFAKLHRLQNLIRYNLLPILKQVIEESRLTDSNKLGKLAATDIIPEEMKSIFSSTVGILPGQVCVSLLRTFKYVLTHDVIEPMEEGLFDHGHRLFLTVLEMLLIPFLEGVRLAEQTVLQPTCESFMESLVDLRVCLGRLGTSLNQHEHCSISLAPYLRICLAVGEVQILLLLYSPWSSHNSSLQMPEAVDPTNPTGLQCLMSFIDANQWNNLIRRAIDNSDKVCCESVNALLEQQLRALVLFENHVENSKEMQSTTCDYLIKSLKGINLLKSSQNAAILVPLLPHEKLLCIVDDLTEHFTDSEFEDEVLNLLKDPVLQENKPLLVSLAWTNLRKIGNLLLKRKRTHNFETSEIGFSRLVKDMSSLVEFSTLVSPKKKKKVKLSFSEIGQKINEACEHILQDGKSEKEERTPLNFTLLLKHLVLLRNLPLPFLPENTKTFLVLGILGVLIVLNERLKNLKVVVGCKSTESDAVECTSKEILLGLLDGPTSSSLSDLVNIGLVVRLLQCDGRCPILLLEHLFESCLEKPEHIQKLTESVCLADAYVEVNINPDAPLISACLLKLLMKKNVSNLPDDVRAFYKENIQYLLGIISECIDCRMKSKNFSVTCIHSLLEAYCVVLSSDSKEVKVLVPHAKRFLSAVFSVLDNAPNAPQVTVSVAESVLEGVMNNYESFGKAVCKETMWRVYKSNKKPELTAKLLKIAAKDDFVRVLRDLCHPLEKEKNHLEVFPDLRLPESLVRISVQNPKAQILRQMVVTVSSAAFEKILQGNSDDKLPDFLRFLFAVARRTKVPLPRDLADIILTTVICTLKVQPITLEYILTNAPTILHLLLMLLLHHFPLVEDRIPAFLDTYQMIVHVIVVNSSVKLQLKNEDIENLAKCALQIEQLTRVMGDHVKDFRAVSQHMVANMLQEFEKTSIHQQVKVHIMNSLYTLLKLCDNYTIAHLSYALSPASLELFRSARSEYEKFYRYTGKI